MLVTHPILVEQLGHFLRNHIPIVRNRDERDFFAGLGVGLGRLRVLGGRCWAGLVAHKTSIHHSYRRKASYSKASNEERSGNCVWQFPHVTK